MKINRPGIPFTKVSFTAASPLSSVNVEVEAVNESNVGQKLGLASVYQYVKVTTKPAYLNVSAAGIEFKVSKLWLPGEVSLFRYSGGSWEKMKTALFGDDGKYRYYSAELPGFSLFAIAAEHPKPAPQMNESGLPQVVPQPVNEAVPVARAEPVPAEGLSARRKAVLAVAALVSAAFASIFVYGLKRGKEQEEINRLLGRS